MRTLLVLSMVVVAIRAATISDSAEPQWKAYKEKYNRQYDVGAEESIHKEIFMQTLQKIQEHNKKYQQGLVTYKLGVNQYTDLTKVERKRIFPKFPIANHSNNLLFEPDRNQPLRSTVDWRQEGAVTPVKNQGLCGSSWSFAATGALEAQLFRKTRNLVGLSEQNLIDCSGEYGMEYGCNGGSVDGAFTYIMQNAGINSEALYPYEAKEGTCRYNPKNSVGGIKLVRTIFPSSEKAIYWLLDDGPVAAAIHASDSFINYKEGVLDDPQCNGQLNHAVLVVGYNTTADGQQYWIVKNSLGKDYGENGYIRIIRGKNMCGIGNRVPGLPIP